MIKIKSLFNKSEPIEIDYNGRTLKECIDYRKKNDELKCVVVATQLYDAITKQIFVNKFTISDDKIYLDILMNYGTDNGVYIYFIDGLIFDRAMLFHYKNTIRNELNKLLETDNLIIEQIRHQSYNSTENIAPLQIILKQIEETQ